jgi:hypothetical protein
MTVLPSQIQQPVEELDACIGKMVREVLEFEGQQLTREVKQTMQVIVHRTLMRAMEMAGDYGAQQVVKAVLALHQGGFCPVVIRTYPDRETANA